MIVIGCRQGSETITPCLVELLSRGFRNCISAAVKCSSIRSSVRSTLRRLALLKSHKRHDFFRSVSCRRRGIYSCRFRSDLLGLGTKRTGEVGSSTVRVCIFFFSTLACFSSASSSDNILFASPADQLPDPPPHLPRQTRCKLSLIKAVFWKLQLQVKNTMHSSHFPACYTQYTYSRQLRACSCTHHRWQRRQPTWH